MSEAHPPPIRARRAFIALVLSGLAPGAGHVYAGRPWRGLAGLGLVAASSAAWLTRVTRSLNEARGLLLVPLILTLLLIVDAGRQAWRAPVPWPRRPLHHWSTYPILVLVVGFLAPGALLGALSSRAGIVVQPDASMAPIVLPGEWVVYDRTAPVGPGAASQLVVVRADVGGNGESAVIRRVVGRAGERVAIRSGIVLRDGVPVPRRRDPRRARRAHLSVAEQTVPRGAVFLVSERLHPDDGAVGVVPAEDLDGQPAYVLLPGDLDEAMRMGEALR